MSFEITNEFKKDESILLDYFIYDNFLKRFEFNQRFTESLEEKDPAMLNGIELIIRPECNQQCEYCYITKHGKKLYPKRFTNEEILNNLKLILDYFFIEKKLYVKHWELFAGDLFYDNLIFDIFDIFYPYLKNIYEHYSHLTEITNIMIPNNCSFIKSDEKIKKMQEYIDKFADIHCRIVLSASIDGKYAQGVREKDEYEDEYYEKLFTFFQKNQYGYHPMIYAGNIEHAIENYDWWLEQLEKYNTNLYQPMLLEVRNPDEWTDEKIQAYLKLLKHIINRRIKMFDNDIEEFTDHLFTNHMKVREKESCGYDPIVFPDVSNLNQADTNIITCSFSENLHIRLGDLSIVPCHRMCYPQFVAGNYIVNKEKNKIIGIEGYNVTSYISMVTYNPSVAPGCVTCPIKTHCIKGCFGAQYEWTGEYLIPILSVCTLFKAKTAFLIKTYYDLGVLKIAKEKDYLSDNFLKIAATLGYDL